MVATVSINPFLTSNAAGTFGTTWDGLWQGDVMDDQSSRNWLAGGVLASTETLPLWGGIAIAEHVPSGTGSPVDELGGLITRATTLTASQAGTLTGFSTWSQAHHMITSPQSTVPLSGSGMSVHFYRLGTNARIVVACNPSLVSLRSAIITQQVSWDFNDSILQPFDASTATVSITSITWASTNGGQGVVVAGAATVVGGVGDTVNISGATNTGTGGNAAVNGTFIVTAFTDNQHFIIAMPAAAGVIGTIAGTILANEGVGALNVKIEKVMATNCNTVVYNAATGFATWNRNGACAVIVI
jgi:hypothetical protein